MSIFDFISTEAGQRRRRDLEDAITYYIPPELRGLLGLAAEANPVVSMERAGQDAQALFAPDQGIMDRLAAGGRMASNMAGVVAPAAVAGRAGVPAAAAVMEGLLGFSQGAQDVGRRVVERLNQPGTVPTMYSNPLMRAPEAAPIRAPLNLEVTRRDASNIFGEGTERVRYTDPKSGGTIEVVARPDGSASVLQLEVPEGFRGQGIGQRLQERVMQDFPTMGGQVSSKAAATTAYRLGRRPPGQPNATLDEVFAMIDDMSSVNMISPSMQERIAPSAPALPTPRTDAEAMARDILQLRAEGRADEVTNEMMAAADPQYMYFNTPLPMDAVSRMARAEEMGFGSEGYHGTSRNFFEFSPPIKAGVDELPTQQPVFAGQTPDVANDVARALGGSVMPLRARLLNTFDPSLIQDAPEARWLEDSWSPLGRNLVADVERGLLGDAADDPEGYAAAVASGQWDIIESDAFQKWMRGQGFNDFRVNEAGSQNFAVSDPTRIRSRFARFDPEFRHLSNLSAAMAAGIPLGLLALPPQEEQY